LDQSARRLTHYASRKYYWQEIHFDDHESNTEYFCMKEGSSWIEGQWTRLLHVSFGLKSNSSSERSSMSLEMNITCTSFYFVYNKTLLLMIRRVLTKIACFFYFSLHFVWRGIRWFLILLHLQSSDRSSILLGFFKRRWWSLSDFLSQDTKSLFCQFFCFQKSVYFYRENGRLNSFSKGLLLYVKSWGRLLCVWSTGDTETDGCWSFSKNFLRMFSRFGLIFIDRNSYLVCLSDTLHDY
jgi:hypothetical protein